jgi:hypothetical protein
VVRWIVKQMKRCTGGQMGRWIEGFVNRQKGKMERWVEVRNKTDGQLNMLLEGYVNRQTERWTGG